MCFEQISEGLKHTLEEILSIIEEVPEQVLFSFVYGLDGSGKHRDYEQKSKAQYSTRSIIFGCFSILDITKTDGTTLWKGHHLNSPKSVRPMILFPSAETRDMLEKLTPLLNEEVATLKKDGLQLNLSGGQEVKATFHALPRFEPFSMLDGKLITELLGLRGAYCTMCNKSMTECHIRNIEAGFQIDRCVTELEIQAFLLEEEGGGQIKAKPKDYSRRRGITHRPLTKANLTMNIPVMHSKIHTYEWLTRLIVRENTTRKWSHPTCPVPYKKGEKTTEAAAEEALRGIIREKMGIHMGGPQTQATGNQFKVCQCNILALSMLQPTLLFAECRHSPWMRTAASWWT